MAKSTLNSLKMPEFDNVVVDLNELKVEGTYNQQRFNVDHVIVRDMKMKPTNRFWLSICSRFGISPSIFNYFTHKEVFDRINEKSTKTNIQITVQKTPSEHDSDTKNFLPRLFAISAPDGKGMIYEDVLWRTLAQLPTTAVQYFEGVVTSEHDTRSFMEWNIGPDKFSTYITLECPIDGYGKPTVWLSLLRDACQNGAVAHNRAFQSGIIIGAQQSAGLTLQRAIESFSNEDGFVALKQRLEASQKSWASILEACRLNRVILGSPDDDFIGNDKQKIVEELLTLTGDVRSIYGVAQLESLSEKRMRALPCQCKVYDLLNFATEIATHRMKPASAREAQVYFGEMISREFDLENSCDRIGDFSDFIDPRSRFYAKKGDD